MTEPRNLSLRLFDATPATIPQPAETNVDGLDELCNAWAEATGWSIRFRSGQPQVAQSAIVAAVPSGGDEDRPAGYLQLQPPPGGRATEAGGLSKERATRCATALARLLGQLFRTQDALWRREAETAACVPVIRSRAESAQLAARLEAVLAGGAQSVGCDGAALYLLDDATTHLKLRAAWRLSRDRLTDPPRPLAGAVADLEALLGHAVVLRDRSMHEGWNVPQPCESAVCVPVSGPSIPIGTLWMFSRQPRDYTTRETNLIEIIAGRIASDLDREALLAEGVNNAPLRRELHAAAQMLREQSPPAPVLTGWDVACWQSDGHAIRATYCDWFATGASTLTLSVGRACASSVAGALSAATLRGALRTAAEETFEPALLLGRASQTLWRCGAGDLTAHAALATVDHESGRFHIATAGNAVAWVIRRRAWEALTAEVSPLGAELSPVFPKCSGQLESGDALILASDAPRPSTNVAAGPEPSTSSTSTSTSTSTATIARAIAPIVRRGAGAVAAAFRDLIECEPGCLPGEATSNREQWPDRALSVVVRK